MSSNGAKTASKIDGRYFIILITLYVQFTVALLLQIFTFIAIRFLYQLRYKLILFIDAVADTISVSVSVCI